jgi:hypothetical protein
MKKPEITRRSSPDKETRRQGDKETRRQGTIDVYPSPITQDSV